MADFVGAPSASRALLIGAGSFAHSAEFDQLPQARRNVEALREALTDARTGLLLPGAVRVLQDPRQPHEVREAVKQEAGRADDLLLVYYAGHGYPADRDRQDPSDICLAVRGSTAAERGSGVAVGELLDAMVSGRTARLVLIADCCLSGGIPLDALPHDRHVSLITSSAFGQLVSPGDEPDAPTPFTAALVDALRRGVGTEEYVTVRSLGGRLLEAAAGEENEAQAFPFRPREVSTQGASNTLLSFARYVHDTLRQKLSRRTRRLRGRLAAVLRWLALPTWPHRVAAGATVLAVIAGGILTGVYVTRDEPCPPPLELRLATAPEEVAPMARLAAGFEKTGADHRDIGRARDCRTAHITVYGAGLDALGTAFSRVGGWGGGAGGALADVGPQPDLWAAQSSAEVELVEGLLSGYGHQQRNGFFNRTPIASESPVLVLTDAARKRLGLPSTDGTTGTTDWPSLRTRLRKADAAGKHPLRLLRPNPTVSGVGLGHTLGMYESKLDTDEPFDDEGHVLPEKDIGWLETEVVSQARSVTDAGQALCELRLAQRDGAAGEADGALVTSRLARRFIDGDPLGGRCTGGSPPAGPEDFQRYELAGVPRFDHPLVTVHWKAADRAERDDAIADFTGWLTGSGGRHAIDSVGYGGEQAVSVDLGSSVLNDRLDSFRKAHPDLRLSVLFDISGSMRERGRYEAAAAAVRHALARLGPQDRYSLRTFPTAGDVHGTRKVVADWRGRTAAWPLTAAGILPRSSRQADLEAAVEAAAAEPVEASTGLQHAVLLVTDGDYLKGRAPRVAQLRRLGRQLRERGVPVVVASMRPYGCAAPHEPAALASASGGACAALSGDLTAELSRAVGSLTGGRPQ